MSEYTPNKVLLPSGLDEIGLLKSMVRLPDESLSDFRRRILLEHRQPTDNSFNTLKKSPGRLTGQVDIPIAKISLASTDVIPRIKVTSTRLYVWEDREADPVAEIDIQKRGSGYFVGNVLETIESTSLFSIEILDTEYLYKYSRQLMIEDTLRSNVFNLLDNYVNKLPNKYVADLMFSDTGVFSNLVESVELVQSSGDYFIDATNGIVFSHELARGYVSYSYSQFPLILYWQPVRCFLLNDEDIDYLIKDTPANEEDSAVLNSKGALYYNELLDRYPLEWGQ